MRRGGIFYPGEYAPLGGGVERHLLDGGADVAVLIECDEIAVTSHHLGYERDAYFVVHFVARKGFDRDYPVFAEDLHLGYRRSREIFAQIHAKARSYGRIFLAHARQMHARILRIGGNGEQKILALRTDGEGYLVFFGHIDLVYLAPGKFFVQLFRERFDRDIIVRHAIIIK